MRVQRNHMKEFGAQSEAGGDVYYYGCDTLFTRHPEAVQRLCATAPTLMPTFLGLEIRIKSWQELECV